MRARPDCDYKHPMLLRGCEKQADYMIFFYHSNNLGHVTLDMIDMAVFCCSGEHMTKLHEGMAAMGVALKTSVEKSLKMTVADLRKPIGAVNWEAAKDKEHFISMLKLELTNRIAKKRGL